MKKSIYKIAGYFFLALFLAFFISNSFFNHTHIVDGCIVVHSHPYKAEKNGNPGHSHTAASYVLIHQLNNLLALAFFSLLYALVITRLIKELTAYRPAYFIRLEFLNKNNLRGPPYIIHF